ncbi:MAG: hypothetical protein KFF68_07655, partial [Desulfosarcina sp.]|nr:hypothetical protein [Desulfosarcina sp.]
ICLDTGHIGIYVSSKFQEAFAPKIAGWLKERDQIPPKKQSPPKKTAATRSSAGLKKTVHKANPNKKNTQPVAKPKSSRSRNASKATHG